MVTTSGAVTPERSAAARTTSCLTVPTGLHTVPRHTSEMLVVSVARRTSTSGHVSAYEKQNGCWSRVLGPFTAYVGRRGVTRHKHEGDGTTPEGMFSLGSIAYGIAPRVTKTLRYHRLVCGDWWDEQSGTHYYNRFVHITCGTSPPFGGDSEALWLAAPYYDAFVLIHYNTSPVRPDAGSAIFLHDSTGAPTTGCVAVGRSHLDAILRWLTPTDVPEIVIAPTSDLDSY